MIIPPPAGTVYNLLILDESGSMDVVRDTTIRGFNELVQTVQGLAREFPQKQQIVSFTTFNGLGIREKLFMQPAAGLRPLTAADYHPDAMTPLLDAIGQSVIKLRNALAATGSTGHQVLVTILTDGEENSSREFTQAAISQLIAELKTKGWTFTYIGANHDVARTAAALSIDNQLAFTQNDTEMAAMFERERSSRRRYTASAAPAPAGTYFAEEPPTATPEP